MATLYTINLAQQSIIVSGAIRGSICQLGALQILGRGCALSNVVE